MNKFKKEPHLQIILNAQKVRYASKRRYQKLQRTSFIPCGNVIFASVVIVGHAGGRNERPAVHIEIPVHKEFLIAFIEALIGDECFIIYWLQRAQLSHCHTIVWKLLRELFIRTVQDEAALAGRATFLMREISHIICLVRHHLKSVILRWLFFHLRK